MRLRALSSLVWLEILWYRGYPLRLLNLVLSPGLMVAPYLLFVQLYGADDNFRSLVAVGLIFWLWLSNFIWEVGYGLENDLEAGTLESLLVTPISVPLVLLAKTMACILRNIFVTVCLLGWLYLFNFSLDLPWLELIALAILSSFALSGFVMILASSVLLLKRSESVGAILQTVLGLLSGVTAPPHLFPLPIRVVSGLIPLTYGIAAVRLALQGQRVGFPLVAWLMVTGIFYAVIGRVFVRRAEQRIKTAGTTGEF